MSIILALDTSTDACSVALNIDGTVHALFEIASKSHTQRLLPMVDEILAGAQLSLHDVDAIAFGRGPGSFTGLRICAGIVQGLAFGASLPVIPVSTLQAMALYQFRQTHTNTSHVLASLDARMDEIYWGVFAEDSDGLCSVVEPERVMKPEDVVATLGKQPDLVGVGSGWNYAALNEIEPQNIFPDIHPRAEEIALLAARDFARGNVVDALGAQPIYLRDTVSWQKRKRIREN
jgi:tRNA threonylcarbamoyladenosine biosynthesis protein TsaB